MAPDSFLRKFHLKSGDLEPRLETQLVDGQGNPVNLTGVTTVRFHMGTAAGVVLVDEPAVVDDAETGLVAYEWSTGDTDTAGEHAAEFEVLSAGRTTTFPNDHNITVVITPAVA